MLKRILLENWRLVVITAVAALALNYAFICGERFFSSTGFCMSCHSMTYPYEGLKKSAHWGSRGINPECRDCHFPPDFIGKVKVHVVTGMKDVVSSFTHDLSTKEKFDKYKDEFARKAREQIKGWDSSPCRDCHKDPKPSSVFGKAAHATLLAEGKATCVDCHQGIFH
ncbi:MAG: NapC/NirT family cytochrome c [Deltaproteobacteria bacterium]|nr:NapC/NirT family cytochrome c [Deltaproteobacteria bacterium]